MGSENPSGADNQQETADLHNVLVRLVYGMMPMASSDQAPLARSWQDPQRLDVGPSSSMFVPVIPLGRRELEGRYSPIPMATWGAGQK